MKSIARRFFLKIAAATGLVATTTTGTGCAPQDEEDGSSEDNLKQEYDYIVVGSGAGGGPVASNLARAGFKVLLLEAGEDSGARLTYQVPAWHAASTEDEMMRWDYWVKHYDSPREPDSKDGANHGKTPGTILYPRAGTLGGCTAHNAMITVYPHEKDWNDIAALTGDDTWRAGNMRKYFQRVEACEYLRTSDDKTGHGTDGWLHVTRYIKTTTDAIRAFTDLHLLATVKATVRAFSLATTGGIIDAVVTSSEQLFGLMGRDFNRASADRDQAEGIYQIPLAIRAGKRNGTRERLLETAARFPLEIRTGAFVTKLTYADKRDPSGKLRVTGVEFRMGKHLYKADPNAVSNPQAAKQVTATARREVILAAGAFNTPQLLKLSGIGPREELESLGIKVRVNLPAVGTNLQDRYEVGVVTEMKSLLGSEVNYSTTTDCTFGKGVRDACWTDLAACQEADFAGDKCLADWRNGSGVYTSNGTVVGVVKRSTPDKELPDLFVFGAPGYFKGYEPGYATKAVSKKNRFTWAVLKAHTGNTAGTVTLRSADPFDTPDINFKYFHEGTSEAAERDLDAVAEGVLFARKITEQAQVTLLPLAAKSQEVVPGPAVQTKEQIKNFVRNEAWGHHASCTVPIGRVDPREKLDAHGELMGDSDARAALDQDFRVRGTTGLRVVDASVFPKIPGFFIVVPIYIVSEKASDVILQAAGRSTG